MGGFNKRVTRTRYIYSNNIIQLQLNHYVNLPHWDIQGLPSQAPCCAEQLQGEEHVSFLWELMDTLKNYITRSRGIQYKLQPNHYVNLPHWDIHGLPSQAPCCAEQLQGEEHVSFLMDTLKNNITRSRGIQY